MAGNGSVIFVAETTGTTPAETPAHAATTAGTTVAETEEVFPPFDPATFVNQLLWLAICFVVLYLVVSRVALPKIGGIIESRRKKVDGDLAEADRMRRDTDAAVANYEATLATARGNAQQIAGEMRIGVRADIDGKRKTAEESLSARMVEAEKRIQTTKTAALANVDAIAADAAQALVARLTSQVSPEEAAAAVAKVKVTS